MTHPMSAASTKATTPSTVTGRRFATLGVRGRIVMAVTLAALTVSAGVTLATITVGRGTLLESRESSIIRQAETNAKTVGGSLATGSTSTSDIQTVLSSLPYTGYPSVILGANGPGQESTSVSLNAKYGTDILPKALLKAVTEDGESRIMRFRSKGTPLVAVGIAVPDVDASYFQIHDIGDIDAALTKIRIGLIAVTIASTILAIILGYWSSGYALRPLRRISDAAKEVTLGQMDTRINYREYENDAELAPLVANFNDMLSALQDRIDRDARFASDVSHELRSPLTTLNASVEVLQNSKDSLPERSQTALDLLTLDMKRFTQLVEDLLEISRFDAGAVRLDLDTVALVPTLERAVRMASVAPIPVSAEEDVADLVIACDKRRLVRVITNFIDNAAKYADGATAVTVGMGREPDTELGTLGTVEIGVEDQGPGVPVEQRSHIFDRFNRGDQGGSRGIDLGVGLGLALAAEHARLQGGSVWVEDRHDGGQGSRFVLELPIIEPVDPEELDAMTGGNPLDLSQITGQVPAVRIQEAPGGSA
ncbi:MAG: HAMP domain-containing histidine kinase [Microthrixaceae bacterium]|nr:HAMP domain-containing histidine kinase [Microthrixaceae bacterium]